MNDYTWSIEEESIMPGIKERVNAAGREFKKTVQELSDATVDSAIVATDSDAAWFPRANGVIFSIGIPMITLPVAVGEAARAFTSPPSEST